MRIRIFQIDSEKDNRKVKFQGFDHVVENGGLNANEYKCVFQGDVEAKSLDDIYNAFNGNTDPYLQTMQGHSLSCSDVVEVVGDIPDIYGKIEYLFRNKEGNATVGDWMYFTSKEDFEKELKECREWSTSIEAKTFEKGELKLAKEGFFYCDSASWKEIDFDATQCEDMDGLRVLMINPGRKPIETKIKNDLASLQKAVSLRGEDSLIEITYPFDDSAVVLGNEEAKLIGMEGNRHIEGSIYAGPLYILNDDGEGDFCDLKTEQIEKYSKMFEFPESISREEVENDCGFVIGLI